jgi:hypothetical protein
VRKAWEATRIKIKDGCAVILADGFREVKEDSNGFADKKAIFEEMDHFELSQYTLKDFDARPVAPRLRQLPAWSLTAENARSWRRVGSRS